MATSDKWKGEGAGGRWVVLVSVREVIVLRDTVAASCQCVYFQRRSMPAFHAQPDLFGLGPRGTISLVLTHVFQEVLGPSLAPRSTKDDADRMGGSEGNPGGHRRSTARRGKARVGFRMLCCLGHMVVSGWF